MNFSIFRRTGSFTSLFDNNSKVFPLIITLILLVNHPVFSQAPLAIPYQAVARTSSGNLIVNQTISVRFSVHDGTPSGTIVYQEKHSPTTNALGLFSVNIGGGTVLTGAMANISWGNGAKFLQVELDPAGGNSYIDMGTSQMMSVPYALSARTVEQKLGKTYLTLSGDISDAQAQAIIANSVGPNTQFIRISNTTRLTTVDLSAVTELVQLDIENTGALTTVNLNNLKTVLESIKVTGNFDLASLTAPSLQAVYGNIDVTSNANITSLDFGAMTTTTAGATININGNDALTSIDLGSLAQLTSGAIFIDNNFSLTSVDLGSITSIPDGVNVTLSSNYALTTLNVDNLHSVQGNFFVKQSYVLAININNLDTITGAVRFFGGTGSSFSATNLKFISGFFTIGGLTNITSVDLSSLHSISGVFEIENNNYLTNLDLSGLTSIGDNTSMTLDLNAFSSSAVNGLLARLANVLPYTGVNINLATFTGTAPPTGQGITDKNTIISNGNTVTTD